MTTSDRIYRDTGRCAAVELYCFRLRPFACSEAETGVKGRRDVAGSGSSMHEEDVVSGWTVSFVPTVAAYCHVLCLLCLASAARELTLPVLWFEFVDHHEHLAGGGDIVG